MSSYAIVEFVEEKSVGVVPEVWIETSEGVMFAYWPPHNVSSKVKKAEIPDKANWRKCRIRIFSYADNYAKALKRAKHAEETSNVDSASDNESSKRKRPKSSYVDESDMDEDSAREDQPKRISLTPLLPAPPILPRSFQNNLGGSCVSNRNSNSSAMPGIINAVGDIFQPDISNHLNTFSGRNGSPSRENSLRSENQLNSLDGRNLVSWSSCGRTIQNGSNAFDNESQLDGHFASPTLPGRTTPNGNACNSFGSESQLDKPGGRSWSTPSRKENNVFRNESQLNNLDGRHFGTTSSHGRNQSENQFSGISCADNGTLPFVSNGGNTQDDNFQRVVLTKLDMMAQKQDEALSVLRLLLNATRGVGGSDMLEDVLPSPIDSIEDLEALSDKLDDEEFKKKMLHFLVALCGHNHTVSTRRILAKIGTNKLWSLYSLKGRKSKKAFRDVTLCRIIIKACLRVHKNIGEVQIEEQIAEFLKHAPHKPGGSRYKNRDDAH